MENGLKEKLDRVTNTIDEMKINLQLDSNAPIEEIAEATDLHTLSNVFIQPDEPDIKDGIWIQTDKLYPYDNIIVDNEIIVPYKWQIPAITTPIKKGTTKINFSSGHRIWVEDDWLYFGYGDSICRYNLQDNNGVAEEIDKNKIGATAKLCKNGNICYYINQNTWNPIRLKKYDLNTKTETEIGTFSTGGYSLSEWNYSPVDNCFYMFYARYTLAIKSAVDGSSVAAWSNHTLPCGTNSEKIIPLGDKVLVTATHNSFLIDTNTHQISQEPAAVKNVRASTSSTVLDMGDYFYVFEGGDLNKVTKYHKETFEAEDVTALFYDPEMKYFKSLFRYKDKFYSLVGESTNKEGYLWPMETTGTSYDSNAVVLAQAPISKTEYQTALWTYPFIKGGLKQSFYDVFYYNIEEGLKKGYPTYYGNGERWIKFKN